MNEYRYITGRIILALFVIIASFMPFFVSANVMINVFDVKKDVKPPVFA